MTLTDRDRARAATVLAEWLASGHAVRLLQEDSLLRLPSEALVVRAREATADQWLAAAARVADLPPMG